MSDFKFQINSKGYLINRESFDLEYKQSFHYGDSLLEYIRSMVGMANNRGGKIIFGIKESPRKPIGLLNDKFEKCDPNKINQVVQEYFSHEFDWSLSSVEFNNLNFGVIEVLECRNKPILCKKAKHKKLREGAIYYRYRGETKEISYPELANILIKEKEKERKLWLSHIEKISDIGPRNIHFMDTYKGEIHIGNEKVLVDEKLLDKIKFIKEGEFVEKEGAPALTLAGEISGVVDNGKIMPTDIAYPYQSVHLEKEFNLSRYQIGCLIFKLNIRGNPKYHESIKSGKKSYINKYSQALYDRIESVLKRYPEYIDEACKEYQIDQKRKRELKNKSKK
jgi:hypothetical protein